LIYYDQFHRLLFGVDQFGGRRQAYMQLEWIFDPVPPSGAISGGAATGYVFEQSVDTFVREVLQNSHDQRLASAPRVEVDFDLINLSGDRKARFLEAIGWPELRSHLTGVAATSSLASVRIRRELGEMAERPLRLLRITDRGTRGLVGGEDQNGENFQALCRNVLDTAEANNERGGSHGLGKAVLWAFSGVSTVLFNSRLGDGEETDRLRFFARTDLPYHTADDEKWAGSGWFGLRDPDKLRAISAWDEQARTAAGPASLTRKDNEPGTSIMILDLDEPLAEVDRPLEDIAEDIAASASRWFWPAITRGTLLVRVRVSHDDETTRNELVGLTPEVSGFADALAEEDLTPHAQSFGDVTERAVEFTIPATRAIAGFGPTPEVEAETMLRVRSTTTTDELRLNQVALTRGSGMVVQYWTPPRHRNSEQTFQAVLSAGLASGAAESDRSMERFLRSCEPPAHDEWKAGTPRQRALYEPGAGTRLQQFYADIQARIDEALFASPPAGELGPERLRQLFMVGSGSGGGGSQSAHNFSTSIQRGQLENSVWKVVADLHHVKGTGPWMAEVDLYLDAESGRGTRIPIARADIQGRATIVIEDGRGTISVDDEQRVTIDLSSTVADVNVSSRTRLRLDVRYKAVVSS
jgi:hypothetical protein